MIGGHIEVTDISEDKPSKVLINTSSVAAYHAFDDDYQPFTRVWMLYGKFFNVKESIDEIQKLINPKPLNVGPK